MEEAFQTIAQASVSWWDFKNSLSRHAIEASDFWLDRVHDTISVEPVTIEPGMRDTWFDKKINHLGHSLVGRFVWLSVDSISFEVNLSKPVQDAILKRFGLEGAYQYLPSMLSDVTELGQTSTQPLADQQTFAFCYGPKIAAIWSHRANEQSTDPAITQAVLFTRAVRGGNPKIKSDPLELQKKYQALLRKLRWNPSVLCTPLYPAYALSLVLHYDIGIKHKEVETQIRKMEADTGFHGFRDRHADLSLSKQAAIEVHELVGETSDYAGRIASTTRKSKMLELLLDFLREAVDKGRGNNASTGATHRSDGFSLIQRHVEVMQHRLGMLDTELAYIEKRIQIQKDMLFSAISQSDTLSTFALAKESNKVAEASREIAVYSYRDASSMKTLAIVTMFFLPGSFISSLFSSQLFDWDSVDKKDWDTISVKVTPQWKLYWAVTAPLTLVVFLIYLVGYYLVKRQRLQNLKTRASTVAHNGSASKPGAVNTVGTVRDNIRVLRRLESVV